MNEQIRELALQADILFYQGHVPETGFEYEGAEVTVEDLKKFAQLIAKECADLCERIAKLHLEDETPIAYVYGARQCKEVIKNHFGVE